MKSYAALFLLGIPVTILVACGKSSSTGTGGSGGAATSTTSKTGTGTGVTNSTTGGPTTTTSTGSGPITCTDTYSNVPKGECDLLQQDCANGNTCVTVNAGTGGAGTSSTACQGTAGLKAIGSTCGMDSECQKGLFCFDVCTPVCCPDNGDPCNANGGTCNLMVTITGTTDFFLVCAFAPQCTLFDPSTCMTNYGCYPDNGPGLMSCTKLGQPQSAEGAPCAAINDCATMTACVGPANQGVCRMMCDPNGTGLQPTMGGCPANETCQPANLGTFGMTGLCMP